MRVMGDVRIKLHKTREMSTSEKSLQFIVIMANCFSLLPVSGVASKEHDLYFNWRSLKVLYSLVMTAAAFYTLVAGIIFLTQKSSFSLIAEYMFCVNWAVCLVVYIRLAMRWPTLIKKWRRVDMIMDKKYGKPKDLDRKLRLISVILISLAIVEHALALLSYVVHCMDAYGSADISLLHRNCIPNFFASDYYNNWVGVAIQLVSIHATFTWTYNDLFIIAISIPLALRFRQIRVCLSEHQNKSLSLLFWKDIREDYVLLSNFCLYLDDCVSMNVFTSFASNLICVLGKFFEALNTIDGFAKRGYFVFSFGFLLFRTIAVAIYAAWVNDESKEPTPVLYSVPSSVYNKEIRRFLEQISFDNVALTGSKMYKVTKGLILNIAGAIVTYELVLIQFSNTTKTN